DALPNYQSLQNHKNQTSGVSDILLFAPVSAFTTISGPTITAPPGPPVAGEEVTITADHEFNSTEGFIKMLCAPFVNQITATSVGETGSRKFNPTIEVFIPGSYAELHEFVKNALNQPAILLCKEGDCEAGFYYQIGSNCVY